MAIFYYVQGIEVFCELGLCNHSTWHHNFPFTKIDISILIVLRTSFSLKVLVHVSSPFLISMIKYKTESSYSIPNTFVIIVKWNMHSFYSLLSSIRKIIWIIILIVLLLWIWFLFLLKAVFLEQYLMLNRRNSAMDKDDKTQSRMARDASLFVCTTMYHELEHEMEQLLYSLGNLDKNRHRVGRHLECHVFFDGCVEGENLNEYVLRLCSLLEKTIRVRVCEGIKIRTPYGMQVRWTMPGGTEFYLHMKDNNKVWRN